MSRVTTNNNVIFQTSQLDGKIYIKEQKGKFQTIRRSLATLLMLAFILIPFIQHQGKQAILFDIGAQKLFLFSTILYPQDLLIFVYIFIIAAFALFFVSSRYGRVWCGYVCPQTIWSLMFFWVQFRVEGNYQAQKRLDALPFAIPKTAKKVAKHAIWLIISFFTATTFLSYFKPATELYSEILTNQLPALYWWWIVTFVACTYVNAGWIKEKMCEHICPYARFQSVMINESTKQISYNALRGEPRAPRKIAKSKPDELGDCVDCNLCVQVCPVGIDIRQGMQYECISCGLCIDACDQVMSRFNYPKGLISYQSITKVKNFSAWAYSLAIVIMSALLIVWFFNRPILEINVLKDRNVMYRELDNGRIENIYELRLINKTQRPMTYSLNLTGLKGFEVKPNTPIRLPSGTQQSILVNVISPVDYQGKKLTPFEFVLTSDKHEINRKATFQLPLN